MEPGTFGLRKLGLMGTQCENVVRMSWRIAIESFHQNERSVNFTFFLLFLSRSNFWRPKVNFFLFVIKFYQRGGGY
jgi:hypothetical protein